MATDSATASEIERKDVVFWDGNMALDNFTNETLPTSNTVPNTVFILRNFPSFSRWHIHWLHATLTQVYVYIISQVSSNGLCVNPVSPQLGSGGELASFFRCTVVIFKRTDKSTSFKLCLTTKLHGPFMDNMWNKLCSQRKYQLNIVWARLLLCSNMTSPRSQVQGHVTDFSGLDIEIQNKNITLVNLFLYFYTCIKICKIRQRKKNKTHVWIDVFQWN